MNIVQNFGHVQNKTIIYRPGIYNLQIRTVTFSDQEKLLEKVELRYLKKLKVKKLSTKNPQIKHYPCSEYVMINRPGFYNLQTSKKTAENVTKNWNWPFLITQPIKTSNTNIGYKSKIVWNKTHNLQTRIAQFTDHKNVWICTNSTNPTINNTKRSQI